MLGQRLYPAARLRRTRSQAFSRRLLAEHQVRVDDLIYPMFVMDDTNTQTHIASMPNIKRFHIASLIEEARLLEQLGIQAVALFPVTAQHQKSLDARAAYDPHGLIQCAVRALKDAVPNLGVIADIALDPFTSHGQDGLVNAQGYVLNDETLEVLTRQALSLAQAGVDILAPSDMMDGRIGAIRHMLEQEHYPNMQILAYSAKYASSLYGPFRDALGSAANLAHGRKETYQMNPANRDEALHEVSQDLAEGADMVMVKPGSLYLDVIERIKQQFHVPTFAYHVSGEYAMIKAASLQGWIDEQQVVMETMLAFKRAGADAILTYYAKDIAQWILNGA